MGRFRRTRHQSVVEECGYSWRCQTGCPSCFSLAARHARPRVAYLPGGPAPRCVASRAFWAAFASRLWAWCGTGPPRSPPGPLPHLPQDRVDKAIALCGPGRPGRHPACRAEIQSSGEKWSQTEREKETLLYSNSAGLYQKVWRTKRVRPEEIVAAGGLAGNTREAGYTTGCTHNEEIPDRSVVLMLIRPVSRTT